MNFLDQTSRVLSHLDMVILERVDGSTFHVPAAVPKWWSVFAGEQADLQKVTIDDRFPFLENFLIDADEFWSSASEGHLHSGVWEIANEGCEHMYEAYAIRANQLQAIVIENLRSTRSDQSDLIRAGRNMHLELLKDIARRHQLELDLRRARDNAVRLEETKTRLLANTSHELRNPLMSLVGMLELAVEESPHDSANLQDALKAATGLKRIVNDLLDFAAIDGGKKSIQTSEFCPIELVREVERAFRPAAKERGLQIDCSVPANQTLSIQTDRLRLRQVLYNFADNAIRYTDEGSVSVSLSASDGMFTFSVRDTGRGIADYDQHLIFEAFQRGSSSEETDGGTGLGLSICQEIAESLGGALALESRLGEGTCFEITLPERFKPEGDGSKTGMPDDVTGSDVDTASIPTGLRILVAEDNDTNRNYLVHVLKAIEAKVDEVTDGRELVSRARSHKYDLILTDCRLTGLQGPDAIAQIKSDETMRAVVPPIIAVTAHALALESEPSFTEFFDDTIIKPFTRAELFRKIAKLVGSKDALSGD